MFLTILTLGIYAAWAKVRTHRYFYANTTLAGQSFEYLANPLAILKGNLIIGGGLLLYFVINYFHLFYTSAVVLAFSLVAPFLVYKSLRFFAHNSSYRNVRFRFRGTLKESYKTYLLVPLLIPFTLGLIAPYWTLRRKKYFFHNFSFGTTINTFRGLAGPFYKFYLLAGLMVIPMMIFGGMAFGSITGLVFRGDSTPGTGIPTRAPMIILFIMYFIAIIAVTFIQQLMGDSFNI